ncbi:MAG: hypothetical protein AAB883_00755 [Patescibacteria group bacterium]
MKLRYILIPVLLAAFVLGTVGTPVFAKNGADDSMASSTDKKVEREVKKELEKVRKENSSLLRGPKFVINGNGEAIIANGKVTAQSSGELTVTVSGISLKVKTTDSTTPIAVGDMVIVKGTIDDSTGVITAKTVRNLSVKFKGSDDNTASSTDRSGKPLEKFQEQINKLLEKIKGLQNGRS